MNYRDEHALSLTRPGKNLFNSIEGVLNQCESLIDRISTSGIEDAHLSRIIKTIQTCIRHTNETLQDEDEADTLEDLVEGKKIRRFDFSMGREHS